MKKNEAQTGAAALYKALTEKQAALDAIPEELEAASGDVVKTVAIEKKARRLKADISALETAYRAATYRPPEPTDKEELLQGLKKYEEAHQARIDSIKADIAKLKEVADQIERDLNQAAMDADATATIELSGKREENSAALDHLNDMLARAEAIPVYPEGSLSDEWGAICKELMPEWENRLLELKTLAQAYKAAASSLIDMSQLIKDIRADLNRKAGMPVCGTVFTQGRSSDGLAINNTYYNAILSIFFPLSGPAI